MSEPFLCDAVRTPIGRYGGALSGVRTDDLAAVPLRALIARHPDADWDRLDDVVLGCANQAGEDNRNVARMAVLLSELSVEVAGVTVNRLCGSGMQAVADAARAIRAGDASFVVAGGVESMSRAPLVMPKADAAFSRRAEIHDTTIGWRFVNNQIQNRYGIDSMPETAENLADQMRIDREDQDRFALWSQNKAIAAHDRLAEEIVPVTVAGRKGVLTDVDADEHPRPDTVMEKLSNLVPAFREGGTVTAGNSSGVNDGACALVVASEDAARRHGLTPKARVLGTAVAGVEPRVMGIGPVPATRKLLDRLGLSLDRMDLIELNEAFAAQALAVLRQWGLADDDPRVNRQGGAIALGHPLGMSGARLLGTAMHQLQRTGGRYALCTMCIGVGQGIATVIERV